MFLQTRIQAIRGFPLLAKDAEFVSKIADILGQLLASGTIILLFLIWIKWYTFAFF
jgi:hypothetical protein